VDGVCNLYLDFLAAGSVLRAAPAFVTFDFRTALEAIVAAFKVVDFASDNLVGGSAFCTLDFVDERVMRF
jgi:hypothetical protein